MENALFLYYIMAKDLRSFQNFVSLFNGAFYYIADQFEPCDIDSVKKAYNLLLKPQESGFMTKARKCFR
jgi:hypothetical protein